MRCWPPRTARPEAAGGTGPETADLAPQPSLLEVETLVEQAREAGLRVDLEIEGEPRPLPAAVDLSAYRIVQEALTNTIKHARARRARVELGYRPDALVVTVTDDGRGIVDQAELAGGGHGLVGMRERVALFGGHLRIDPSPGGGLRVSVTLPLDPGPQPAQLPAGAEVGRGRSIGAQS